MPLPSTRGGASLCLAPGWPLSDDKAATSDSLSERLFGPVAGSCGAVFSRHAEKYLQVRLGGSVITCPDSSSGAKPRQAGCSYRPARRDNSLPAERNTMRPKNLAISAAVALAVVIAYDKYGRKL